MAASRAIPFLFDVRCSTRIFFFVFILVIACPHGALAQVGGFVDPADAERKGQILAARILSATPSQPLTTTGLLTIRDTQHHRTLIPVTFEIHPGESNWSSVYNAHLTNGSTATQIVLTVVHSAQQPEVYRLESNPAGAVAESRTLMGNAAMIPFAGSDFWLSDLGLEFLHWPKQRLLGRDVKHSQSCYVLESINPNPASNALSRVVSWLDIDTVENSGQAAIVHAEAYDAKNNLLKEFDPKEFEKVNGHWQLKEMEIDNRQTDSRTRIDFDLKTPQPGIASPAPLH